MLVLSRRVGEQILLPNIGVIITLVKVNGQSARIGVEAPPDLKVYRGELVDRSTTAVSKSANHELCNRLSQISLGLHLYCKQRDAGMTEAAEQSLADVIAKLSALDRSWITSQTPSRPSRSCKTLLVEDDVNERELLAGFLRLEGCDVDTATDGDDALEYLAGHDRPDVVLLDMNMPRRNGAQTLRAIRDNGRYVGIRVYAVSGLSPDECGITSGLDGWFPKPLNPRKLLDTLRSSVTVN